jgi:SNF2 family DNA or RNA helicase
MDNQSVDRAFRFGQKKDVIVYRLITSGTIEEHTYRQQVSNASVLGVLS